MEAPGGVCGALPPLPGAPSPRPGGPGQRGARGSGRPPPEPPPALGQVGAARLPGLVPLDTERHC